MAPLQRAYNALVSKHRVLQYDAAQAKVITQLDALIDRLHSYQTQLADYQHAQHVYQQRKHHILEHHEKQQREEAAAQTAWAGWARWWAGERAPERAPPHIEPPPSPPPPVKGLYIWGSVGSGKR